MTGSGTGAAAPYTDAARARLLMAYEACELADLARANVPIGEQELNPDGTTRTPGAVLADAARVLAAAQRFFEAAAVFERVSGADWQLIGDVLGVPPRTARVRFTMSEAAFRRELPSAAVSGSGAAGGEASSLRGHMIREPLETALDLDDWVLRHRDGEADLDTAPVSGGLARREPQRRTGKTS
ncbi:hypothetical protein [Streptomyces sp. TP-A0874]|uniref:hypothetical protein n=1 Tax=Streptomyces sp. TP-A0874 TaxID=549819 RepID=UPI000853A279|nr:hypothetical protein [Streptomyces sp. TP-A0874]